MNINLSAAQLRRAAEIKDTIADLENELNQLLGESITAVPVAKKRRKVSATTRKKWRLRSKPVGKKSKPQKSSSGW